MSKRRIPQNTARIVKDTLKEIIASKKGDLNNYLKGIVDDVANSVTLEIDNGVSKWINNLQKGISTPDSVKEIKRWDLIKAYIPHDNSGMYHEKNKHGTATKLEYEAKIRPCIILDICDEAIQVFPITSSKPKNKNFAWELECPELKVEGYDHSFIQFNWIVRISKKAIVYYLLPINKLKNWKCLNDESKLDYWTKQKVLFYKNNKKYIQFQNEDKVTRKDDTKLYLKWNFKNLHNDKFEQFKDKFIHFFKNK